jgi:DNA-directed RNA polymerase alpha subunit
VNLDDPISDLHIPARARRALLCLGIDTVGALLKVDTSTVETLKGFGQTTMHVIEVLQSSLANRVKGHASVLDEGAREAMAPELAPVTMDDIRQSLRGRALRVLERLRIEAVADFMNLTESDVMSLQNVGAGTWNEIWSIQQSHHFIGRHRAGEHPSGDDDGQQTDPFRAAVNELGPRAKRVLLGLNITSLDAFLRLDEPTVKQQPNVGKTTWRELRCAQKTLSQHGVSFPCDMPFSEESIRQMPLFSDWRSETPPDRLHPTFFPHDAVELLDVPSRASSALKKNAIHTIGELICTPKSALMEAGNFGVTSLRAIQESVLLHLQRRNGLIVDPGMDGASWRRLIGDILARCVRDTRQRRVLELRVGLLDGNPQTLDDVAKHVHVTRERVRQIERLARKEFSTYTSKQLLAPLLSAIHEWIQSAGGILTCEDVAQHLAGQYGWRTVPPAGAVRGFLGLCSGEFTIEHDYTCVETPCRGCGMAGQSVLSLLQRQHEASLNEGLAAIAASCAADCRLHLTHYDKFSHAFVVDLMKRCQGESPTVYVSDGRLYSRSEWMLRNASIGAKCEVILERASAPMHYQQVTEMLAREHDKNMKPLRVHAYLSPLSSVLMWDRGVFVHHKHARYDKTFVQHVAEMVCRRLSETVPFLSVFGLFREYCEQVVAAGIPTDRALYSVLRREASASLTCDRYPYIRLATAATSVRAHHYVEQILEDAGEPVSVADIRKRLSDDLGLRYTHCTQAMAAANHVIPIDDGRLMHLDDIMVSSACLDSIAQHAESLLRRIDHISVERLFADKKVTCLGAGIEGPRMLYGLLAHHMGDKLSLNRYPQIRMGGDEAYIGICDSIVAFVQSRGGPTPFSDIHDLFVQERRYGSSYVSVAVHDERLIQYYPGCYVTRNMLGVTSEHMAALLRLAKAAFEESLTAGGYWARLDTALEIHDDNLPALRGGYAWTADTAYSMLRRCEEIAFIGNARQTYVCIPNKHGITSLVDACETLVRNVYGGGCALAELEEHLVSAGVIRKHLTKAMLVASTHLDVTGHQVCVKDRRP